VPQNTFNERIAQSYDRMWPELHADAVVEPAVDFIAALAGDGAALELGIGTGRIGLPLSRRGVPVHGIEISEAMIAELRPKPGADAIGVTVGDFATASVAGRFSVAYLVRNTITNLTTQDEQVACFENVARHLEPGGCFVIENYIPAVQRLPPGEIFYMFDVSPIHVGYEEYDLASQIAISHHHWILDGGHQQYASAHRYLWPAELDLMARIAGMKLRERWADWNRAPFTSDSRSHISVWEKT
jgi:SAM-dependent methyltransferase